MRKARPLSRHESTYRDDRMVLIACDDKFAPKQYFDFFSFKRVKVKVIETLDCNCSAADVLARLKTFATYDNDERWLVLDTDHYVKGRHIPSFIRALRSATRSGIKIALSRPCFEFWLLLHYCSDSARLEEVADASDALNALRTFLPNYDKTNLRSTDFILDLVSVAIDRCREWDSTVKGGLIPKGNTSRIYKIWDAIISIESEQSLPDQLRRLRG